jgi:putative transposase
MGLERNTQHVYRLTYHFVLTPKDRHKVFVEPYSEAMKAIIQKIGYNHDFDIPELEIPDDNIHMGIKGESKVAPSHVIKVIKSISIRECFRLYQQIIKQCFWGSKVWTQSYFVETIGNANEETIWKYVQNQLIELDNK